MPTQTRGWSADAAPPFFAAAREEPSLDELLARHVSQLHAYVHAHLGGELRQRESSLDVAQSLCRDLLAARDDFRYRGQPAFRAWLFTAARNKIRDQYRFHRGARRDLRREELDAELDGAAGARMDSPTQAAIAGETAGLVRAALAELTAEHREVIRLARIVGLPHRAIAASMNRTEEATRQLLGRALVQFALALRRRGIAAEQCR